MNSSDGYTPLLDTDAQDSSALPDPSRALPEQPDDSSINVSGRRKYPLYFEAPSKFSIVMNVVKHFASILLPIYTMFVGVGKTFQINAWTSLYVLSMYFPLYMGFVLMYMAVDKMSLEFIYYTLVEYGVIMKYKKRKIWMSKAVWFIILASAVIFAYEIQAADQFSTAVTVVLLQALQLLVFYYTALYSADQNLVTLNEFLGENPQEAASLLSTYKFVSENRVREKCCQLILKSQRLQREFGQFKYLFRSCFFSSEWEQLMQKHKIDMWKFRDDIVADEENKVPTTVPHYHARWLWPFKFLGLSVLPPSEQLMGRYLTALLIVSVSAVAMAQAIWSSYLTISGANSYFDSTHANGGNP